MLLRLSKHFCDQWRCYFKEEPPSSYRLLQILNQSKWIQRCRLLYDEDGEPYKMLATYWHPDKKLVIKVDWMEGKVVTVITPKSKGREKAQKTQN